MTNHSKLLERFGAQFAYDGKTLNDLSEVVAHYAREIDMLKAEIEVLGREVLRITEGKQARIEPHRPCSRSMSASGFSL